MANYATTGLYTNCAPTVSGILCKSATAKTTCEYKKTPDECGQNINGFTRNVMEQMDVEGEISGASPGGICSQKVGATATAPFTWGTQMNSPGVYVCTSGGPSFKGGEYATFALGLESNEEIG